MSGNTQLLWGDDVQRYCYFFKSFLVDSVKNGAIPLWNPYQFSGYPFIANSQCVNLFYPPGLIFFLLPIPVAFSWYLAFHLILAVVGMYWLLRHIIDQPSSFIGGILYGLSGFMMTRIWAGHLDIIASSAYIPIIVGLMWTVATKGGGKNRVLAGGAIALQFFAGYQTIALFTWEALALFGVVLGITTRSIRPILRILAALVLGLGIAAVGLLPILEFTRASIRSMILPYSWTSYGRMTLDNFALFWNPSALGVPSAWRGPAPNYFEHTVYMGKIGLGLAVIAIGRAAKNTQATRVFFVFFFLLVVGGLWIAFASNAWFNLHGFLWSVLPVYRSLRFPTRHIVLVVFGMSGLAGMGLSLFKQKLAKTVLMGLVIAELVWFGRAFIATKELPQTRHDPKLIEFLHTDKTLFRIHEDVFVGHPLRDTFDFNAGQLYKVFSTSGYDPTILSDYYEFIDAASGNTGSSIEFYNVEIPPISPNSAVLDFLNVKYVLVPTDGDTPYALSGRYKKVLDRPERGYRLYENTRVLPRFYFVSDVRHVSSRQEAKDLLRKGSVDLSKTVLVQGDGDTIDSKCDVTSARVQVISYGPNAVRLDVSTPCAGMLVSSEVMYPGWRAYIDHKEVPIIRGNLAFRTLFVPEGKHVVEFRFMPTMYALGAGISLFFVCLGIILLCFGSF